MGINDRPARRGKAKLDALSRLLRLVFARPAHRSYRALGAPRLSRYTDEGSQFHDCLIESPCPLAVSGREHAREIPDRSRTYLSPLPSPQEDSSVDSRDIRVHRRDGFFVGERGDSASGVRTDTWKLPH